MNQPRTEQHIMHDVVIPALGRAMNKGNPGQQIVKLDYTSEPLEKVTWVEITTDAGDSVTLTIDY